MLLGAVVWRYPDLSHSKDGFKTTWIREGGRAKPRQRGHKYCSGGKNEIESGGNSHGSGGDSGHSKSKKKIGEILKQLQWSGINAGVVPSMILEARPGAPTPRLGASCGGSSTGGWRLSAGHRDGAFPHLRKWQSWFYSSQNFENENITILGLDKNLRHQRVWNIR